MFDTGAARSILHEKIYYALPKEVRKTSGSIDVDLFDVHNKRLDTIGQITLPIQYGNHTLHQEVIITNGISEDCILGSDAIFQHGFIFDGQSRSIYLSDKPHKPAEDPKRAPVDTTKSTVIAPRSKGICHVRAQGVKVDAHREETFLFTPEENIDKRLHLEQFIGTTNEKGNYQILAVNTSDQPIHIARATTIGTIETACVVIGHVSAKNKRQEEAEDAQSPQSAKTKTSPLLPDVDPKHANAIHEILKEYPDLFASKNAELGQTGLIKHTIETQGNGPIRQRPYRTARHQKDEMERQIQEMLAADVIRPSVSPWAAPVVLVEKKSGEQRFCVDYRKLNGVTKKDSYPLPRIDDTLDMMHGKRFFTTLDLASGYWQIELEESAKEKTAFIVENNLYEFNRMSFGPCNAPATFQRLMNHILRTVLGKSALVYLDDVIIFSDSLTEHFQHIREVFKLIGNAGLKLKLKKCQFLKDSVNYLGHIISAAGISPDPQKIERIATYKVPSSADEVRSFLGLAGYYRRFIANFGKIAASLTAKTHKDMAKEPFIWTEKDQNAFEQLRNALITSPILAYPDFNEEFLLFTDACDYGIGAVLSQVQQGKEVVIAYASQQLKPAERKYATVEKEAFAVVFAIDKFRHYLLDKPFTVISDHRPLQWLQDQKDNNGRLGRWAIQLANVNYKIKYRPGKVHQNADCLSRIKIASIHQTIRTDHISDQQTTDQLCIDIRTYLEEGELPPLENGIYPTWAKEIEFFKVINGVLYRREPPVKKGRRLDPNYQVVLPLALRPLVLKELHDDPTGGHLAYHRTYTKVKTHYYWPNMRAEIKEYCKACEACIANTTSQLRTYLHPHELANAPFEVIGIDFLGPIQPMSTNGNKYIMVMTDYFSKWVEAAALPNQKAETTAECLHKHIIQRHGPPKAIVTDRGSNFTSKLFRALCKNFNVKQKLTTAYNPASNGETERYNRTLTTMLRKELADGNHHNWENLLGDVCFAYRSTVHTSTMETPNYLVHGRDPNLAINNFLETNPEPVPSASDYIGRLNERLRLSFQLAREANLEARRKHREQYNKRVKIHKYQVGDRVLLDVRTVKKGDSRKFTSKFRGHYRIIKIYNNQTADIADESLKAQRVHLNRLKPLFETMLWRDEPQTEKRANDSQSQDEVDSDEPAPSDYEASESEIEDRQATQRERKEETKKKERKRIPRRPPTPPRPKPPASISPMNNPPKQLAVSWVDLAFANQVETNPSPTPAAGTPRQVNEADKQAISLQRTRHNLRHPSLLRRPKRYQDGAQLSQKTVKKKKRIYSQLPPNPHRYAKRSQSFELYFYFFSYYFFPSFRAVFFLFPFS